jgi:hypothetical protein
VGAVPEFSEQCSTPAASGTSGVRDSILGADRGWDAGITGADTHACGGYHHAW